jgi:tetratricopeptide (TPR) repeat protein
MIGFTWKKCGRLGAFLGFAVLGLSACVQAPVIETEPAEPVPQDAAPETHAAVPVPVPSLERPREPLSEQVLYDVLLGEIAGQRGELDVSGDSYLDAARASDDPRIAERALKILTYAKEPEKALKAARRWVELAPDNLEARQALAVLALRNDHDEEALSHFEHVLEEALDANGNPYHPIITLLAREPDNERALNIMRRLVAQRDTDAEAHFAYARLAVHAKDWELAEQEVGRSLELRPYWTSALILQAQINLKQDKGDVARRQMQAALDARPDDTELRLAYARLLVDLDDYEAARRQYRTLLEQQPGNGQVVYSLALLALDAGNLDEARGLLEQLVELEYQLQQAYYYLGIIAEEQEHYARALSWYRRIEKGDHWLEVQIRVARLEAKTGEVEAARERLRRLRMGNPTQAQRLYLVEGELLTQLDRHEDAHVLYSQYLETRPDDTEILYARALVAEHLDRLDQAERDLLKVLEQDPDNARALNALGYTLADRTDRYQEALEYIEKAFAQAPDDPAVIDSMGWVLFRLGRFEEAREYLTKAYTLTEDGEIAAHLVEVMWMMGDREEARALWEKARQTSPDNEVLKDTVRRLSD